MDAVSEQLGRAVESVAPSIFRVEGRRVASAIAWSDTQLVTVATAVAGLESVRISGMEKPAKVEGWDLTSDIALLTVEGVTAARWSEGESLKVGHLALVLGRPGARVEAALGMIRDLGGSWVTTGGARVERWIEVDGSLPRGFPGGPLVDGEGRVLGMNSRHVTAGGGTLPTAAVRKVVEAILGGAQGRPGYLGAALQPVEVEGGKTGLMVLKVEAGGPAAQAGILQGDVLLGLEEFSLGNIDALRFWLASGAAGRSVSLQFLRGGELQKTVLKVGEARTTAPSGCHR